MRRNGCTFYIYGEMRRRGSGRFLPNIPEYLLTSCLLSVYNRDMETATRPATTLTPAVVETYAAMAEALAPQADMASSAGLCVSEARDTLNLPNRLGVQDTAKLHVLALGWVLRSLEYSVGIFHPTTKAIAAMCVEHGHPNTSIARQYGA